MRDETRKHARSFASVAQAYDRARPSYPEDSVSWLVGSAPARVLELGAGTGKLTELLVAAGHDVIATEPLPEMIDQLRKRVPGASAVRAGAEQIPLASRSVDVVVCAQAFHWFDDEVAVAEIARVLRPGGVLALVWNLRDAGIPWVRKLGAVLNDPKTGSTDNSDNDQLVAPVVASPYFGTVEACEFRFWQTLRRDDLFDLVRSRSYIAVMQDHERDAVLARVGALYDDYGRGPDGMQMPYVTQCFRAVVTDQPPAPVVMSRIADDALAVAADEPVDPDATQAIDLSAPPPTSQTPQTPQTPPEDPGTVLIDFR